MVTSISQGFSGSVGRGTTLLCYNFISSKNTYLATFKPLKNLAISWSEDCQGRPRARTMQLPSISSSFELEQDKEKKKMKKKPKNVSFCHMVMERDIRSLRLH